jgi:curved DNA-binding protein CbpA
MSFWFRIAARGMTVEEALEIFGLRGDEATDSEIKNRYRQLAKQHHPDVGSSSESMVRLNLAYEVLKNTKNFSSNKFNVKEKAPWQTDERASSNSTGVNNVKDANYCKKVIYENAIKSGEVEKYSFMAFDGFFFRGSLTVFCNDPSIDFASDIISQWNGFHYKSVAIICKKESGDSWEIVRINNKPVRIPLSRSHYNPINDPNMIRELKESIRTEIFSGRVDTYAGWYGDIKKSQYVDGGDAYESRNFSNRQFLDTSPIPFKKVKKSKLRKDKKGLTDYQGAERSFGEGF